jgi:S-adenosylmethionine-dependent methyltransferase
MSVVDEVKQYYNENCSKEWERLENHPFEFIFTTYMMNQHIKAGDRILDIGGGPGRYSIYYAKRGCDVTLVDLSEENINLAKEKANEENVNIAMYAENCLNLDAMPLGQFDHVFLMGPLYHLTDIEDRKKAVQLAIQKLKPNGILYCSFILSFAGVLYDLKNGPGFLPQDLQNEFTRKLIDSIVSGNDYVGPAFTSVCFINQRQIEPFMSQFPLKKLHLFGQEGILALNEHQVKTFPKEEYDLWIETAKKFLELPEFLAYSEHAMYIGEKIRDE